MTSQRVWERLVKIPNGHKFFRDKLTGKISACDDSGRTPDLSEDGALWIQINEPIVFSEQFETASMIGTVPVIKDRTGESLSILSGAREVLWLVRNLGMGIRIQSCNFGKEDDPIIVDDKLDFMPGHFQKQFVPLQGSIS